MAAAFKAGRKPGFDNGIGFFRCGEATSQDQHICIVVPSGKRCHFFGQAEGCTRTLYPVCRDRSADAGAAKDNAAGKAPVGNGSGNPEGIFRIVVFRIQRRFADIGDLKFFIQRRGVGIRDWGLGIGDLCPARGRGTHLIPNP